MKHAIREQYIDRIERIAEKYPRSREDWDLLEKYAKTKNTLKQVNLLKRFWE